VHSHHAGLSGESPHVGRRRDADPFPPHSSMSGVAIAVITAAVSASIMVLVRAGVGWMLSKGRERTDCVFQNL
jgi:hypothetical protein